MKIHILDKYILRGEMADYYFLITEKENINLQKKLVIFGANVLGSSLKYPLLNYLKNIYGGGDIYSYMDNDLTKVGRQISGLEIISPQMLKENPNDYFVIITASLQNISIIKEQLINFGMSGDDISYLLVVQSMDFESFENMEYVNAAIDAFSHAYKHVPLHEINLAWLITWISGIEWSKGLIRGILSDFKGKRKIRMLDIGPGIGIQSIALKKLLNVDITWIDVLECRDIPTKYSNENFNYLKENFNIHLIQGNIETIEHEFNEGFDIILFSQVLEHFHFHPIGTMRKIISWLKQNGRIYLGVPDNKIKKGPRLYGSWKVMPIYNKNSYYDITDFGHQFEYYYEEAIDLFTELQLNVLNFTRCSNNDVLEFVLSKN